VGESRWGVEVVVEGFDSRHPLWDEFVELASDPQATSLPLTFRHTQDSAGDRARIRAIVQADSAEAATRCVMRIVREIGDSIDLYGQVPWSTIRGAAYRL
jgi:hypothetical protein